MKEAMCADLYSVTSLALWLVLATVMESKSLDLSDLNFTSSQITGLKKKLSSSIILNLVIFGSPGFRNEIEDHCFKPLT